MLSQPAEHVRGARNYHSVALLMPDGRVWSAGSSATRLAEWHSAIFTSKSSSPGTTAIPVGLSSPTHRVLPWREAYQDKSTFANEIERVVVVRCGSCTHSFNSDQRLIELKFRHAGGDELLVDMLANNFIFPSGPYLIFTIRKKREPSACLHLEPTSTWSRTATGTRDTMGSTAFNSPFCP